jgi:hypothetical protein
MSVEMLRRLVVGFAVLLAVLRGSTPGAAQTGGQSSAGPVCTEWHDCRQQAVAAADAGDYQRFHDLAWRTMQTGPPKDPALMYLLARAQSLSGRPHDALVMLQRLAELGVANDAATSDDFRRTRDLPGWSELADRLAGVPASPSPATAVRPAASAAPSGAAKPPASVSPSFVAPAASAVTPVVTAGALEAARFSTGGFTVGGLAYDAVSNRFLLGDRLGRKLIVVGQGADHANDFVRADSAGFHDISAIEIDARRGDLWVASAAPAESAGTLHKLQLVSGRPLRSFSAAADLDPITPVDLAVTPAGAVLVLDAVAKQLLVLRVGGSALERVIRLEAADLASVTAGEDEGVAYVAHRDGVSRIDLRARTATPVTAARSISLAHLERIRWYRRALIAIMVGDDGARRIVRFDLNGAGRVVTQAKTLDAAVPPAGRTFATVSGDELVYLVDGVSGAAGEIGRRPSGPAEFIAYRVNLR